MGSSLDREVEQIYTHRIGIFIGLESSLEQIYTHRIGILTEWMIAMLLNFYTLSIPTDRSYYILNRTIHINSD